MSLARAFTTRRNRADKPSTGGFLGRSTSHRSPAKPTKPQISAPINLISSTNVLSFDAPDIVGTVPTPYATAAYVERSMSFGASDSSSRSSGDHSDVSSASARDYSTDASSLTSSPNSPEPNHLSCYFKPSVYTDLPDRPGSQSSQTSQPSFDAPAVPQRAPSHSKKAHMHVSRQRSISRLRSPPSTAQEMVRESSENFASEQIHPFGKELEQLNEIAEEFGGVVRDAEADADYHFMEAHGLAYFSATDYMMEVQEMLDTVFEEEDVQAGWI
ncbi:hypothetical protein AAFC00_000440 [Neodothiora populina]|uniref:Uncharacterized protein n=1 Tax=Neodothiora populina TaxID=2781224 RepID=A0ABR3PE30_9PEZI